MREYNEKLYPWQYIKLLMHAVLTNTQMWDQDLTQIEGLEAAVLADLEKIRTEGAEAAYKSCL